MLGRDMKPAIMASHWAGRIAAMLQGGVAANNHLDKS